MPPEPAAAQRWWADGVMLARAVEELPRTSALRGGCQYEPKWDGYRALIRVDAGRGGTSARIRSRHGTDLSAAFPDVAAAAARQLHPGTVLDGELVVWDVDAGRLDFAELGRRVIAPSRAGRYARQRPASFVAFDLLADAGEPLGGRPLRERRRRLEGLLAAWEPPLQVTPATRDRDVAEVWLRQYAEADVGIEGLVVKGLGDPYRPGRRGWLKLRTRATAEAVVGAVTGSRRRPERLVLGRPDPATGRLVVAGGTGPLTAAQQAGIGRLLRAPAGEHPWPSTLPAGRLGILGGSRTLDVVLVEPSLVVEVEADTAHEHGRWRHLTRFTRVRPDLLPGDVRPPTTPAG